MKILKPLKAIVPRKVMWLYRRLKIREKLFYGKAKPLRKTSVNSPQFIITLTSYGKRVSGKAPYAIRSLFNQSVQADRIVLWLAHGTEIPASLKKLQNIGLEIKFCDDLKSYKKLIPALLEFPDDILITADDDIHYIPDWFKKLKELHMENPGKICCHRAHEISLDKDMNIMPYGKWRGEVKTAEYPKRLFPTGAGGILYPPHSFNSEVFNLTKFQTLSPTADDIWFWAMARRNGKEYALVKRSCEIIPIGTDDDELWRVNVEKNRNDEQMKNVITAYHDVYESIL